MIYFIFAVIVLLSLILSWIAQVVSRRYELFLDKPNQRSSHARITPRCGGIPIYLISLVGCMIILKVADLQTIGYLLGAAWIAAVGTIDDLVNLGGRPKIAGMVLAAIIPMACGLKLGYLEIALNNQLALYLLTFIWIYGFINAFNFMDGIDGLVGGTAAIGAFFIIAVAVMTGNLFVSVIAMLLLATCMGFLVFNFHPASLFLGDAGSMFLGYNFAVLGVMLTNGSANAAPIYLTLIIFAPLIYDSMVTFIRRGINGKNVFEAHREHLYQRLIIMGMSHRDVSLIYYFLALLFGLLALMFLSSGIVVRIGLIFLVLAIMIGFSYFVRRLESLQKRITNG